MTKFGTEAKNAISTVKDGDIRLAYVDSVEKFVKDNSNMGERWQHRVLNLLLDSINAPGDDGDLRGSSPYMLTFMSEHIRGLDLVTLQQLREAYKRNGDETPFPGLYVETGLALVPGENGGYDGRNKVLAEILAKDFVSKGLSFDTNGIVPNFAQLSVIPHKKNGLAFILNETATRKNIPILEDYGWSFMGGGGLFRACLDCDSGWGAYYDGLEYSDEGGRVVKYDAKGVAPKKLKSKRFEDKIRQRLNSFRYRSA